VKIAVVLEIRAGFAVAHRKAGAPPPKQDVESVRLGDLDFFAGEGGSLCAREREPFSVTKD